VNLDGFEGTLKQQFPAATIGHSAPTDAQKAGPYLEVQQAIPCSSSEERDPFAFPNFEQPRYIYRHAQYSGADRFRCERFMGDDPLTAYLQIEYIRLVESFPSTVSRIEVRPKKRVKLVDLGPLEGAILTTLRDNHELAGEAWWANKLKGKDAQLKAVEANLIGIVQRVAAAGGANGRTKQMAVGFLSQEAAGKNPAELVAKFKAAIEEQSTLLIRAVNAVTKEGPTNMDVMRVIVMFIQGLKQYARTTSVSFR
jgi:hypothetical protein